MAMNNQQKNLINTITKKPLAVSQQWIWLTAQLMAAKQLLTSRWLSIPLLCSLCFINNAQANNNHSCFDCAETAENKVLIAQAVTAAKKFALTVNIKYEVDANESVQQIAAKFAVPVAEIIKVNNLGTGYHPLKGDLLLIPVARKLPTASATKVNNSVSKTSVTNKANSTKSKAAAKKQQQAFVYKTHTVQAYDNLSNIAKRYQVSVGKLATMNGLLPNDFLKVGQNLRLPDGAVIE